MQTAFFNKSNKIKRADQIPATVVEKYTSTRIFFHTYFPCISNCWARPRVYRKLYTLIGGQRAEKFENHWPR